MPEETTTQAAAPEAASSTAPTTPPEPQEGESGLTRAEALSALKEARAEAAANRIKAREAREQLDAAKLAAERAQLGETERLQAELQDAKAAILAAESARVAAETRATLAGKVSDVDLAMSVAANHQRDDGTLDIAALLEAHPALQPQVGRATTSPSNPPSDPRSGTPLNAADFRGKDPQWVRENIHRLQSNRGDETAGVLRHTKVKLTS